MQDNKHNQILCSRRKKVVLPTGRLSNKSQLKMRILSWPLLFLGTVLLFAILILSPWDIFLGHTEKNEQKFDTISLFARTVQVDREVKNYDEGWWAKDKAMSSPDLDTDASLLNFSDDNSAFYAGGDYALVFSAFNILREEEKIEEIVSEVVEADVIDLETEEEEGNVINLELIDNDVIADEDNFIPSHFQGEGQGEVVPEEEAEESIELEIEGIEETEEVDIENNGTIVLDEVEVVEEESGNNELIIVDEITADEVENNEIEEVVELVEKEDVAEIIEVVEPIEEVVEIIVPVEEVFVPAIKEELSLSSVVNKIFGSTVAVAQEYITTEIEKLEDLGEFKGASVRLSLAVERLTGDNDELPIEEGEENIAPSYSQEEALVEEVIDDSSLEEDLSDEELTIENFELGEVEIVEEAINSDELEDETIVVEIEDVMEEIIEVEELLEDEELLEELIEEVQEEIIEELVEESVKEGDSFSFIKAARADDTVVSEPKLVIWYTLDNISGLANASSSNAYLWHELDYISEDSLSNAINGDYLDIAADFLKTWEDVENLKIKVEARDSEDRFMVYLDSLWIDAEYVSETELEKLEKRQRFEEALTLLSDQTVFEVGSDGEFLFRYTKNENRIWETLGEMVGAGNFWEDVELDVSLVDASNKVLDTPLNIILNSDGDISIELEEKIKLKPGKYSLKFHIEDKSGEEVEVFDIKQDFYWGVLAINTDKDIYSAGDKAYTQIAVLDEGGHSLCEASLTLNVTQPNGDTQVFENKEGTENIINISGECGNETVTDLPDYFAHVYLEEKGEYIFELIAKTAAGERMIKRVVEVDESDYVISRSSATRIYPKADYSMTVTIDANKDFYGDIVEVLPHGFKIKNYEINILGNDERDPFGGAYMFSESDNDDGEFELTWRGVDLRAGDKLEIKYTYDAPDISPEFYTAGPISMTIDGEIEYTEKRYWAIASDAVNKRAKTVMFAAGTYTGGATAGQNTNADLTFSSFNWQLAETGVDIRNAFIIFETQFEAYNATGGNYTGYKLGFDSCEENCTASAFGASDGQTLDDNSNILAYDENESNQVRLLLDVTAETDMAAYTGGGVEVESQVGYHLKNGTTKTSIASARAILVVSYDYDKDSKNLTNTIVYPLESTNGTDSGSRQSSQAGCTVGTDCPIFDYHMDIPEFPGVATTTNRLSQWFKLFTHNDSNNANDIDTNVNIETFNVDSSDFHYEAANGGTQGNLPGVIYPDWASSGYAENSAQQLEYYINTGTNFSIGGEVIETYIASSSAAIKTKTVVLPIGVIDNGGNTNLNSNSVDVYFPENGTGSGVVDIKKAWLRVKTHNQNSAALSTTLSTKVGGNATSPNLVYAYNGGGTVVKPLIDIIHVIPSADYTELESANINTPKNVVLNATQNAVTFGGISAELVITYTYTEDEQGYLSNITLFAGQSSASPSISYTATIDELVMPEDSGKTLYSGGLYASFLNSDSGGDVGNGTVFDLDAGLSTSTPICTAQYLAEPDDVNSYSEMYKDVSVNMDVLADGTTYYACYADDENLGTTDGAKMNGILTYTYGWENNAPTSTIISAVQKQDNTNSVDISIGAFDADGHEISVKMEYATGTTCVFTDSGDPSLDETDSNITATEADPAIDNSNEYQIGTDAAYIETTGGQNIVDFDWLAGSQIKEYEGDYCLQITANDGFVDQATLATTTLHIDTLSPTIPGDLSLLSRTGTELVINYGATSTENNFKEYKIFYKLSDGTAPMESDSVLASSTDVNLGDILFSDIATTSISGLTANMTYSVAIWSYDMFGNVASSTYVNMFTNDAPIGDFNSAMQRADGSGVVDFSIEADDFNDNDTLKAKIVYEIGTACTFLESDKPSIDENFSNILADYGLPAVTNSEEYQVGTTSAWILTSPGSNTIELDWLAEIDLADQDDIYCLSLILNDSYDDQVVRATTTLAIDYVAPTATGNLTEDEITVNSINLIYASTSPATDSNEPSSNAYKIFYKQGTSGVTESDIEIDNADLNAYDYNSATSTLVAGLDQNTWYVFNIFSYDNFGNVSSSTEIAIKTKASVSNDSLLFVNPETKDTDHNIAIAGVDTWVFRAVVSETNGYFALASTTLYLANENDSVGRYSDFVFTWDQSLDEFSEIGADANSLVTLDPSSSSSCGGDTCTLDFVVVFDKNLSGSSIDFAAELITGNDSLLIDNDLYNDFYQVRVPYVEQIHYRWRNDDGGE